MTTQEISYAMTYNPCLVWLLDTYQLKAKFDGKVNMSSFMENKCEDDHYMWPEYFEARLNRCRIEKKPTDPRNWPHKLIWA